MNLLILGILFLSFSALLTWIASRNRNNFLAIVIIMAGLLSWLSVGFGIHGCQGNGFANALGLLFLGVSCVMCFVALAFAATRLVIKKKISSNFIMGIIVALTLVFCGDCEIAEILKSSGPCADVGG